MSPLPWHLCAVALLAGAVPRNSADAVTGSDPALDEYDLVQRGVGEYAAALARTVRGARHMGEPARETLASLLDGYVRWVEHGKRLGASEIAAAFEAWISAARGLPPDRRSDALLIADRVMDAIHEYADIGAEPPSSPARLRVAGAEFQYEKLGGSYVYGHTFLREARRVAPPGAPRDRVLLREMEIGFDYRGLCGAGDDVTAKIIKSGEALLRRNKDPRVRASAHLMIADAYGTIVALANGDAADYFDSSAYRRREEQARREAIAHYRAGLAIDPNPADAELVRRDLRRLLDGAAPRLSGGASRHRMFYCVYD